MNVTLNIQNDEELRAHIKDSIKGQVLSVVRDELTSLAKEELAKGVMAIANRDLTGFVKNAVEVIVGRLLYKELQISEWSTSIVQPHIENIVSKAVSRAISGKDWSKLVDTLAKEKVKALIQ